MAQKEILEFLKKERIIGINVYYTQKELSDKLNVTVSSVNRALKGLLKMGLIEEREILKSRYIYRFTRKPNKAQDIVVKQDLKHNIYTPEFQEGGVNYE